MSGFEQLPEHDLAAHSLEVNLKRVGLPVHLIDQVIAEVEDSLWLALKLQEAESNASDVRR